MPKLTDYIRDESGKALKKVNADIHQRWKQLNTLTVDISERASKQLFITNGAGSIALMSYFGIAKADRIFFEMKISLCFFVVGVILAMVVTAFLYHGYSTLLEAWRQDSGKFNSNNLDYDVMCANDEKRYKDGPETAATITSYLSFTCFILGSLTTMAVMLCGKSFF